MGAKSDVDDPYSRELCMVTIMAVITISMGVLYNLFAQKVLGLVFSSLLLVAMLVAMVAVGRRGLQHCYAVPLAIGIWGGIAIFAGDVWVSLFLHHPVSQFRIPFNASAILILSTLASMYLDRRVALGSGLLNALNLLIFTIVKGDNHLILFNLIMQPVLLGFSGVMYFHLVKRDHVKKLSDVEDPNSHKSQTLDLGTFDVNESEFEIMELLVKGYSIKEIANERKVGVSAIQNRLSRLYRKLGVSDRSSLMYILGQKRVVLKDRLLLWGD